MRGFFLTANVENTQFSGNSFSSHTFSSMYACSFSKLHTVSSFSDEYSGCFFCTYCDETNTLAELKVALKEVLTLWLSPSFFTWLVMWLSHTIHLVCDVTVTHYLPELGRGHTFFTWFVMWLSTWFVTCCHTFFAWFCDVTVTHYLPELGRGHTFFTWFVTWLSTWFVTCCHTFFAWFVTWLSHIIYLVCDVLSHILYLVCQMCMELLTPFLWVRCVRNTRQPHISRVIQHNVRGCTGN